MAEDTKLTGGSLDFMWYWYPSTALNYYARGVPGTSAYYECSPGFATAPDTDDPDPPQVMACTAIKETIGWDTMKKCKGRNDIV